MQVANVIRLFLNGEKTGKAMDIWNLSQSNRELFLTIRIRDPAYLILPASLFSSDVGSHSNDLRDVAKIFDE